MNWMTSSKKRFKRKKGSNDTSQRITTTPSDKGNMISGTPLPSPTLSAQQQHHNQINTYLPPHNLAPSFVNTNVINKKLSSDLLFLQAINKNDDIINEEEVQQDIDVCTPTSDHSTNMRYTDFKRQKTSRYISNGNEGDLPIRLSENIIFTPSPSTTKSSEYHGSPIRYIDNNNTNNNNNNNNSFNNNDNTTNNNFSDQYIHSLVHSDMFTGSPTVSTTASLNIEQQHSVPIDMFFDYYSHSHCNEMHKSEVFNQSKLSSSSSSLLSSSSSVSESSAPVPLQNQRIYDENQQQQQQLNAFNLEVDDTDFEEDLSLSDFKV